MFSRAFSRKGRGPRFLGNTSRGDEAGIGCLNRPGISNTPRLAAGGRRRGAAPAQPIPTPTPSLELPGSQRRQSSSRQCPHCSCCRDARDPFRRRCSRIASRSNIRVIYRMFISYVCFAEFIRIPRCVAFDYILSDDRDRSRFSQFDSHGFGMKLLSRRFRNTDKGKKIQSSNARPAMCNQRSQIAVSIDVVRLTWY